ncbi:methyltransferase domain-containing protein [Streptomyces sp. HC44]|uniref:Methyltransferase domain-containing protein n=1 Tax=Streptomyces scabichelini TaxID=2711217 RepID=A0A6G4VLK1_9ACTN|nr:methyltransferase domain-containing protein [Streptomyces scabichelini]NGO15058.1 methyltransferase domain-containing protein [Streptomyces scabichelini]
MAEETETGFQLTGSAPERYERYVAPIMAPFVEAVVDAVDLFPGAMVLDLACGTGFAARVAAARVGPAGRVFGADANDGMLKVAAAHHPRMYPDIEFTVAPADQLQYADDTFDAVVCQQGAQFFPDLDAAFAQTARVTRPGGRFAATVWASMDKSPYFVAQQRAIAEHGGPEAAAAFAAAFSCTAERLTTALRRAGFQQVTDREVTFGIDLPPLPDFAAGHLSALPWGQAIADTGGQEALTSAGRTVHDLLRDHTAPDGTATVSFTSTLVTGVR